MPKKVLGAKSREEFIDNLFSTARKTALAVLRNRLSLILDLAILIFFLFACHNWGGAILSGVIIIHAFLVLPRSSDTILKAESR